MRCQKMYQRHRFTPRGYRHKEYTLANCIRCGANNPNYLPKTLDEVFEKFGTNREQHAAMIRRFLIPRTIPGDLEMNQQVWDCINKCGLNHEYSEFQKSVKKDFMNLPMSYV